MNPALCKTLLTSVFLVPWLGSSAWAEESINDTGAAKRTVEQSAIDKLVANQPSAPAASQAASEKPMTINFSDFVKDGAGCGVPNLDTSSI